MAKSKQMLSAMLDVDLDAAPDMQARLGRGSPRPNRGVCTMQDRGRGQPRAGAGVVEVSGRTGTTS